MLQPFIKQHYCILLSSLLLAMVLSIVPLPAGLQVWRPSWVLLVLISGGLLAPQLLSLGAVWCLGLFQDLLVGDVLGLHAAIFVLIFFIVRRLHAWLSGLPLWQTLMAVWLASSVSLLLQYWVQSMLGLSTTFMIQFSLVFINGLLWLVIHWIMSSFIKKYQPLYL